MIDVEVVTNLHKILINKYGGIHGVRDYNGERMQTQPGVNVAA